MTSLFDYLRELDKVGEDENELGAVRKKDFRAHAPKDYVAPTTLQWEVDLGEDDYRRN